MYSPNAYDVFPQDSASGVAPDIAGMGSFPRKVTRTAPAHPAPDPQKRHSPNFVLGRTHVSAPANTSLTVKTSKSRRPPEKARSTAYWRGQGIGGTRPARDGGV